MAIEIILSFLFLYYFFSKLFSLSLILLSSKKRDRNIQHRLVTEETLNHLQATVTAAIPFFNETENIMITVDSLLNQEYQVDKILLMDDGSTNTLWKQIVFNYNMVSTGERYSDDMMYAEYRSKTHQNLFLIKKPNQGKSQTLNLASQIATTDLLFFTDADCYLSPKAIRKMVIRMNLNKTTIAVGATIRILNTLKDKLSRLRKTHFKNTLLTVFQEVEYIVSFIIGRSAMNIMDSCFILSGACYLVKRKEFNLVGGFSTDHCGEDLELTINLYKVFNRKKNRSPIDFVDEPLCFTDAPHKIKHLYAQRVRWHQGLVQSLRSNLSLFLSPRYGIKRMFFVNGFITFEGISSIVDIFTIGIFISLYQQGHIASNDVLSIWLTSALVDVSITLFCMCYYQYEIYDSTDKISLRTYIAAFFTPLIYKPLITLFESIGILKGLFTLERKNREWGTVIRA
jgi:biofilm PGA synthesis N-glycosyltransferase PgaC